MVNTQNIIMTELQLDVLDTYIVVLKNIVPKELCQTILDEYSNTDEWISAGTGSGVRKEARACDTIEISQLYTMNNNANRLKIDNDLFECMAKCIAEYNGKFPHSRIAEDTGYELLRYKKGEFYIQHVDSFLQAPRLVTASVHLNDDYEGGEFTFFDRRLKYRLNTGDVLMFPSTFMYPHEVMPVTSGTRYSIVTWFR